MAQLTVDTQPSVWAAAPGTDEGTLVGRDADGKLGFNGTTPIAKPTIPTAATGTQIAAMLNALGLCNLS